MPTRPSYPTDDIVFENKICRYYGDAQQPTIKYRTENGGWKLLDTHLDGDEDKAEVIKTWDWMVENADQGRAIKKRGSSLVIVDAVHAVATDEKPKRYPVAFCQQLEQAAFLVNHRYEILTKPAKAQSRAVIEIGIIMLAVKENLPHGQLNKWRSENTRLSESWDNYCRRAAQKFIDAHGQGTAVALIEGSGANQRQVEHAEQLLLEFTGGKGPSALLHDLGIKKRDGGGDDKPPMEKHEAQALLASKDWNHIADLIVEHSNSWLNLTDHEIEQIDVLIWDTVKAIHNKAQGKK